MVAAAGLIRDQEGKGGAAAFLYGGKEGSRIWKEGRRLGGFRKEWRIGLRDFLPPLPPPTAGSSRLEVGLARRWVCLVGRERMDCNREGR
jgi:hypothetical protein